MDKETINKLKKWVEDHPEEADAKQINLTTGKEFTMREVLNEVAEADNQGVILKEGVVILGKTLDKEDLEVIDNTESWIKRI
ncbi:MAG: hypothetical protein ACFFG0_15495 [Candidatus Thorarchaeota archaeon]